MKMCCSDFTSSLSDLFLRIENIYSYKKEFSKFRVIGFTGKLARTELD